MYAQPNRTQEIRVEWFEVQGRELQKDREWKTKGF